MDSFDVVRIGWSTFVKILLAPDDSSKLLVQVDVGPFRGAPCAPAFCSRYVSMLVVDMVVVGASVTVAQHTEGLGGLVCVVVSKIVVSVGDKLGLDGALEAGEAI